jgi:hypothetical protein
MILWVGVALTAGLAGCGDVSLPSVISGASRSEPGWSLEKTAEKTVNITWTESTGKTQSWEGQFFDDSPRGTPLNPLPAGLDNGLYRWVRPGCAPLSFVLTERELKCTACVDSGAFVAYTATCPLDQQRLPVQGWRVKGLKRPSKVG